MYKKWLLISCVFFACVAATFAQPKKDTAEIMSLIIKEGKIQVAYPDSALAILHTALKKSEAINFPLGIGCALGYSAMIYANRGQYEKAIAIYKEGLQYCSKTPGEEENISYIYNSIGTVYKMEGHYDEALAYYNYAVQMSGKRSIRISPGLYNNIGAVLLALGRYDQALYYLDEAEKTAIPLHSHEIVSYAQMNKGIILNYQGKKEQSIKYLEAALKLSQEHHISYVAYLTLVNLADVYNSENKPQNALTYLFKAQAIKGDINPSNQAVFLSTIGTAYMKLHEYNLAEHYFLKILQLGSKVPISEHVAIAHENLSALYQQTGQYKKALDEYKSAALIKDSTMGQSVTQNLNQLEVKFRTSEKDRQIIQNQLQISEQKSSLRQKNAWLIGISIGILLLLTLLALLFSLYKNNQHKQNLQEQKIKALQQQHEITQLNAMMRGEEKERSRLARELHDGIGGMLASINMTLSVAIEDHPEIAHIQKLEEAIHMLRDTSSEVRKTAHNLMPDILIRHNLKGALIIYCRNINAQNKLQINLQCDGPLEILDKSIELILYRIVQELLQNIVKHAKATAADVLLSLYDNKVTVTVEDNGIGFNVNEHNNGYGLKNLNYRVRALQGTVSIMSERGTTIFIEFDLEKLENKLPA